PCPCVAHAASSFAPRGARPTHFRLARLSSAANSRAARNKKESRLQPTPGANRESSAETASDTDKRGWHCFHPDTRWRRESHMALVAQSSRCKARWDYSDYSAQAPGGAIPNQVALARGPAQLCNPTRQRG